MREQLLAIKKKLDRAIEASGETLDNLKGRSMPSLSHEVTIQTLKTVSAQLAQVIKEVDD